MGNHYRVFIVLQFADKTTTAAQIRVFCFCFNVTTFAVKIFLTAFHVISTTK